MQVFKREQIIPNKLMNNFKSKIICQDICLDVNENRLNYICFIDFSVNKCLKTNQIIIFWYISHLWQNCYSFLEKQLKLNGYQK